MYPIYDLVVEQWTKAVEMWRMLPIAGLISSLLSFTGMDREALLIWLFVTTFDLALGIALAIMNRKFNVAKMYKWVIKVLMQILVIVCIAGCMRSLEITTGIRLFFSNWILLFYILLDTSSAFSKLAFLGLLPKPAFVLLKIFKARTSKVFLSLVDDPELAKEMSVALEAKKAKKKAKSLTSSSDTDTITPN